MTSYKQKKLVSPEYGHFVEVTTGDREGLVHVATNSGGGPHPTCGPWLTPEEIDDLILILLKAKKRAVT